MRRILPAGCPIMTVLTFHGAARTVTGSCFQIESAGRRVLVDCGLFQGSKTVRELNYGPFSFDPGQIDAVLLTHAHIDHSGLIPKLVKHGFGGKIHATGPTADLCSVMLPDSGYIQETEVERINRRNVRKGKAKITPIYTLEDAKAALKQFSDADYETWFEPCPGIKARYWNAGHMLGSASIEILIAQDDSHPLRLFFSGDVGPDHKLLQPDPEGVAGFDYVISESTYGSRDKIERTAEQRRQRLAEEVNKAADKRGALLIPSFAVERTQEVVTDLMTLMARGEVPQTSVFIDSPLALKASEIFKRHAHELENGDLLLAAFNHPNLFLSHTVEDSKAIGKLSGFHIVIAASGMCEAGRIRHHLKNHLWNKDATILMVGYQATATLGRLLKDGVRKVRIHGEEIVVRAEIAEIRGYSGHADGPELIDWMRERTPVERGLFLVHGEEDAMQDFTGLVESEGLRVASIHRPAIDDSYDLSGREPRLVSSAQARRIEPKDAARLDWHNDLTQLILDINETVEDAADERARAVIIRRLRRSLKEASDG